MLDVNAIPHPRPPWLSPSRLRSAGIVVGTLIQAKSASEGAFLDLQFCTPYGPTFCRGSDSLGGFLFCVWPSADGPSRPVSAFRKLCTIPGAGPKQDFPPEQPIPKRAVDYSGGQPYMPCLSCKPLWLAWICGTFPEVSWHFRSVGLTHLGEAYTRHSRSRHRYASVCTNPATHQLLPDLQDSL